MKAVVVRLQHRSYNERQMGWASVGSLREPPTHSRWVSYPKERACTLTTLTLFTDALENSLQAAKSLDDDQMTGSWISALIYLDAVVSADALDGIVYERLHLQSDGAADADNMQEMSLRIRQTCASLRASVNQVAAFRNSYPATRSSDYHDANHFLERLLSDASALARDIKETFDAQHQFKNLQLSTLAVNETRSAIARKSFFDLILVSLLTLKISQSPFLHLSSYQLISHHHYTA